MEQDASLETPKRLYWLVELMTRAHIVWMILQITGLTCEIFLYQKKMPKEKLIFFGLGAISKALFGNPCNGHGSSFMPDDLFCSL